MEPAGALRPINHRERHAVFDAATRIKKLRLGKYTFPIQLDERRIAD